MPRCRVMTSALHIRSTHMLRTLLVSLVSSVVVTTTTPRHRRRQYLPLTAQRPACISYPPGAAAAAAGRAHNVSNSSPYGKV
ncbi:hypothetical protein R3P38DRAFT_3091674, partial [Favolaschia claudopus]